MNQDSKDNSRTKEEKEENLSLKDIETNMKGGSNDYTHNC